MKTVKRISNDSLIVTVNEDIFKGVRLVTNEEWQNGWIWDGPWIERMILEDMKENRRNK